jgi:hypothetical protein
MTRHSHDNGHLVERAVDYDYVVHHADGEPGLLVVTGVPASVCDLCDEYWFDDAVGFELSRFLEESEPGPGEVRTIGWVEAHAA